MQCQCIQNQCLQNSDRVIEHTYELGPQRSEASLHEGEPQDVIGNADEPQTLHMAQLLGEADDQGLGNEVDGQSHGSPPADDDGEDPGPDGEEGDDHEGGGSQRAHHISPHATAVKDAHAEGQATMEKRAVLAGKNDLKVTLQENCKKSWVSGKFLRRCVDPRISWRVMLQAKESL